jgi:hypothetical protein
MQITRLRLPEVNSPATAERLIWHSPPELLPLLSIVIIHSLNVIKTTKRQNAIAERLEVIRDFMKGSDSTCAFVGGDGSGRWSGWMDASLSVSSIADRLVVLISVGLAEIGTCIPVFHCLTLSLIAFRPLHVWMQLAFQADRPGCPTGRSGQLMDFVCHMPIEQMREPHLQAEV